MATNERRTLSVIRRLGVVRAADLEEQGIPRRRLYALLQKGKVERQARGVYAASNHARTAPVGTKPGRFRPSDTLLAFLQSL